MPTTRMREAERVLLRKGIRDSIKGCRSCSLSETATSPVPFSGVSSPNIVMLGEAPGRQEDSKGEPFVGPSGQKLRAWIDVLGFDTNQVSFVNSVCCFPNRTPTNREVAACHGNLVAQLSFLKPQYVVALGAVAFGALMPVSLRMGDVRGLWFRVEGFGITPAPLGLATWHPAAVLRNPTLERTFEEDLDLVLHCANNEWMERTNQFCYKGCYDVVGEYRGLLYCSKHPIQP